jgi:hypothetical protein
MDSMANVEKVPYFSYTIGESDSNRYDLHFHNYDLELGKDSKDVDYKFFIRLFETRDFYFNVEDFLEHQFQCTSYPKHAFLDHVKFVISLHKDSYSVVKEFTAQHEAIEHRVSNWIANKALLLFLKPESIPTRTLLEDIQLAFLTDYFFKYITADLRVKVDRTDIVKFLHVVTGLKFSDADNSKFYDSLKAGILNSGKENTVVRHLKAIEKELERVQLKKVLPLVQAEIRSTNSEIDRINKMDRGNNSK